MRFAFMYFVILGALAITDTRGGSHEVYSQLPLLWIANNHNIKSGNSVTLLQTPHFYTLCTPTLPNFSLLLVWFDLGVLIICYPGDDVILQMHVKSGFFQTAERHQVNHVQILLCSPVDSLSSFVSLGQHWYLWEYKNNMIYGDLNSNVFLNHDQC